MILNPPTQDQWDNILLVVRWDSSGRRYLVLNSKTELIANAFNLSVNGFSLLKRKSCRSFLLGSRCLPSYLYLHNTKFKALQAWRRTIDIERISFYQWVWVGFICMFVCLVCTFKLFSKYYHFKRRISACVILRTDQTFLTKFSSVRFLSWRRENDPNWFKYNFFKCVVYLHT